MSAPKDDPDPSTPVPAPAQRAAPRTMAGKARHVLFGPPRSIHEPGLFHRISLIPFLAWVGLGADGLSSSSYGPEEAYRALGEHVYLGLALAAAMATTVLVISAAYSRIIEEFPHGGGGYVVASKLLGERIGLLSGAALLVDYVLTITVSIAAAGDALFSLVSLDWHGLIVPVEAFLLIGLTILNLRGVRESVVFMTPIFILFLVTHLVLIVGGIGTHLQDLPATTASVREGFQHGSTTLGLGGMLLLFAHAYSLGGGTYTGIEAVSNGLPIMREPRVQTAKRTMVYMAGSLAFTASGLLLCYLLWRVEHVPGLTMNAVLASRFAGESPFGHAFVWATLVAEGALLVVAAQAGFLDGPRVLANMANDSWVPHRFAALSDRLTTSNGIVLMGTASLVALLWFRGSVSHLVVMYSINVFLTFSLSLLGMSLAWWHRRNEGGPWIRRLGLFLAGFALCVTILVMTIFEKFTQGGWVTVLVTGTVVGLCLLVRNHYRKTGEALSSLYSMLGDLPEEPTLGEDPIPEPNPKEATAAVLVGSYGGLGIHTVLNIFRAFPGHFRIIVFISVGVIDSGGFKGEESIEELRKATEETAQRYLLLAARLGIPATSRIGLGIDAVEEAEKVCLGVRGDFPNVTFFAGKVIFEEEHWYQRLLHNETAFAIQKRLQWDGETMVILPARVNV